jgi:hypothetical protein
VGLFKTAAKVAVASSVHGRVQRRQQLRWAEQDAAAGRPASFPPGDDPGPGSDVQAQLALIAQLNDLRTAGALTDAEFEAKKAQILRG